LQIKKQVEEYQTRIMDNYNDCSTKNNLKYGCIFCKTGKENAVAEAIENIEGIVRARAVKQTQRFTRKGIVTLEDRIVIKGYVFFEAKEEIVFRDLLLIEGFLSVLTDGAGDWQLKGDDLVYVKIVMKYDGLIGLSKAYKIGDHIQIAEGPLKDFEGQITKIDKRNHSGQVTLYFNNQSKKVWLCFDIIQKSVADEQDI